MNTIPEFHPPKISPGEKPKVSILLITYNHGKYIGQAIEGILAQHTEYTYRIHVIEDCSTDNTQEVVMRYVEKYPDVVIPYFNKVNIGNKVTQLNFIRGLRTMDGEYWCVLEGDDYWSSPQKLQKQISFLEANPDFIGCAHNTIKMYEDGVQEQHRFLYWENMPEVHTVESFIRIESFFHASSMMFRNIYKGNPPAHYANPWSCDIFMNIDHARFGPVRFFDEDMSVYRAHAGGMFSNMKLLDGWLFNIGSLRRYNRWLGYRYLMSFSLSIARYCRVLLYGAGKNGTASLSVKQWVVHLWLYLFYSILHTLIAFPKRVWRASQRLLPKRFRPYWPARLTAFGLLAAPLAAVMAVISILQVIIGHVVSMLPAPFKARMLEQEKLYPNLKRMRILCMYGNPFCYEGFHATRGMVQTSMIVSSAWLYKKGVWLTPESLRRRVRAHVEKDAGRIKLRELLEQGRLLTREGRNVARAHFGKTRAPSI